MGSGHQTDVARPGLRSLLSVPAFYDLLGRIIGGDHSRKKYVKNHIKPFPNARILDIGCGTGGILPYLPKNIEYVGFDASPRYIKSAVKKYGDRGTFICKKVGEFRGHGRFDIILATAVLHHLGDREAKMLFETALHGLKPGGYLVTFDNAYVEGQSQIARWIISRDRGGHVRSPNEYMDLARPYFPKIENVVLHDLLRIPYTHFIMKCAVS